VLLAGGCDGDETGGAGPTGPTPPPAAQDPRHGFKVWHADFPRFGDELPLPAANPLAYTRSRSQAIAKVVANLSGGCSPNAWRAALEFVPRMGDEAVPLLIEAMDASFQATDGGELVQNAVETMGRCARPAFAAALLRALEHPREGVRDRAMHALIYSGDAAAVERARGLFAQMSSRAQVDWLRAARAHLGAKVVGNYQALLRDESNWGHLKKAILEEALKLPPALGAGLFEPLWPAATGELRVTIAGVLHANGDSRGTLALRETLRSGAVPLRVLAVTQAGRGELAPLQDDLLALTIHDDPLVRAAAAAVVGTIPGENVDKALEVLALDAERAARDAALGALGKRGYRPALERIAEGIRTESGTRMLQALSDAVAAKDPGLVPAIVARMKDAPPAEQQTFLSALGRMRVAAAFAPLRAAFLAPERPYKEGGEVTTTQHAATLLTNLDEAGPEVRKLFDELPLADHRRRAMLLHTLGNMANTTGDRAFAQGVFALYRRILLDPAEIPQLRLHVLHWLQKDLRIEDALALKARAHDPELEPDPAVRATFNAWLWEYF
jgi:hypothetical protein